MKLITRDTDYAIRAICFMAKKGYRVVSVSELVKELKIPKPFLRKILQILNKSNVLRSYKGSGGGFRINKPADKIFIMDLIIANQGPFELFGHTFKDKSCHEARKCQLKKKLDVIESNIKKELKSITIADLICGKGFK
jgi:Rrf2 family protein